MHEAAGQPVATRARPSVRGWLPRTAATVVAVVLLAFAPSVFGDYTLHMLTLSALAVVLAISYRLLLVGGRASLCHGTFYALGAYGFAALTTKTGAGIGLGVLVAVAVAVVGGLLVGLPAMRTAGAYFFLVTFAFYVVVQSLTQNFTSLTNGFAGIVAIPAPTWLSSEADWFRAALVLALAAFLLLFVIDRARWGLELRAVGAHTDLAKAIGVNTYLSLLLALVVGAALAGVGGAFYASYTLAINPTSFGLLVSLAPLMYVMIGGPRYLLGPVLGAVYVTLVPLLANWSPAVNAMFGAGTLLVVMFVMPRGLVTTAVEQYRRRVGRAGAVGAAAAAGPTMLRRRAAALENAPVLLEAAGLRKRFGGVAAVQDVSLVVREGEILGLIGPNGSGKSTTFNLLTGFLRPDAGRIVFGGNEITHERPHTIVRQGIARSFQAAVVFEHMTVYENVLVAVCAHVRANPLRRAAVPVRADRATVARAREVLAMVGLAAHADEAASSLPYGLKKALGVGIALATRPRLLAVDEPAAGMTETEVETLTDLLFRIRDAGVSVLITEHRVAMISALCDRVVALHDGRAIAEGTPAEVFADPVVQESFLGQAPAEEHAAVGD